MDTEGASEEDGRGRLREGGGIRLDAGFSGRLSCGMMAGAFGVVWSSDSDISGGVDGTSGGVTNVDGVIKDKIVYVGTLHGPANHTPELGCLD